MNDGIVSTILARCKRCYSCIRECPAQAIKVINGQATVIHERCIVCGHCVKVCSQNAKRIASDIAKVRDEILTQPKAIAIVAPSFAASFPNDYLKLPGALRKLGFSKVIEAAFGADLISSHYLKVFESENKETVISSACPAVVNYIEKYHTDLVPNLAKMVSPMIAMGRYLKANLGSDYKVVFIGPCIAKKQEYFDDEVRGAIDAVLTFTEIKQMFADQEIDPGKMEESNFDPPHAYMGKAFPLAGGLLKRQKFPAISLKKKLLLLKEKGK